MNVQFIGRTTGKIYAEGEEAACHRLLIERYPDRIRRKGEAWSKKRIFPEVLDKVRIKN